jgi:hypothetical protein
LLEHHPTDPLGAQKHPGQVDVEDTSEVGERFDLGRLRLTDAGVIDQHIDLPQLGPSRGHQSVDLTFVGDIATDRDSAPAAVLDLLGEQLETLDPTGRKNYVGARGGCRARERRAQARGSAGDQNHAAIEAKGLDT